MRAKPNLFVALWQPELLPSLYYTSPVQGHHPVSLKRPEGKKGNSEDQAGKKKPSFLLGVGKKKKQKEKGKRREKEQGM